MIWWLFIVHHFLHILQIVIQDIVLKTSKISYRIIFFYFLQIVTLDNFSATNPVELGGPGGPSDPCDPCGPLVNVFQVIYVLRLVGVIGMWSG